MLCRTNSATYLAIAVALLAGARSALAQEGAVGGVVLAERSLRPVAGAQIVAEDTTLRAVTDANGRFRLAGLDREADAADGLDFLPFPADRPSMRLVGPPQLVRLDCSHEGRLTSDPVWLNSARSAA